jgi:Spy/CpxP family protein refolding chaperone
MATGTFLVIAQTTDGSADKKWGKGGQHRSGKMHRRGGMMFRGLDLTEDQKAQMKAFREASKPSVEPLMTAMKENRKKFMEAKKAGADETQLTAIRAEAAPLRAQMKLHREASMTQMMSILTDEQKTKLAEMKEKRQNRMKEGKGKRSGKRLGSGDAI